MRATQDFEHERDDLARHLQRALLRLVLAQRWRREREELYVLTLDAQRAAGEEDLTLVREQWDELRRGFAGPPA
jgi:hypothetical protein